MSDAKYRTRRAKGAPLTGAWSVLFACFVAVFVAAAPLVAHEGHIHRYMGTISSVHQGQVTVKTTDGKQVTFSIGDKTQIVRGTQKASAADLSEGRRVVVEAEGGKEPMAATRIKLGTASK